MVYTARFLEPTYTIRNRWQYNNWMVASAGFLAGEVAGSTWEQEVQTRIFDALNMTESFPSFELAQYAENRVCRCLLRGILF